MGAPADGSVGIAVLLAFMALSSLGIAAFCWHTRRIAREKIRLLAEHLGGTLEPRLPFGLPSVDFAVRGHAARMSFGTDERFYTALTVRIPESQTGRLSIVPETLGGQFHRLFGVVDVEIGDRRFDAEYIIQSRPELLAQRVFDPSHRDVAMEAVRRLRGLPGIMIRVQNARLELQVGERLMEPRSLLDLVRSADTLVGCLTAVIATGIEWGESGEEPGGLCPICTTGLSEPLTRCGRCASPHHRECWAYFGRCATYGCEPGPRRRRP